MKERKKRAREYSRDKGWKRRGRGRESTVKTRSGSEEEEGEGKQ
jgi:hypothetical protein